jgi:3-mercaptopropionate dioxygenase
MDSATINAAGCSAALQQLIRDVREVVRSCTCASETGERVAELLRPRLGTQDFLTPEQMEPAADGYRQHVLHVEENGSFSIVSLVWLPGQCTPVHDHVSWCVVGVHRGQEHETDYDIAGADGERHLRVRGEHVNPVGCVASLVPPGDIHRVANGGTGLAVSLHIYGADIRKLGSSIRRRYDLDVRCAGRESSI